MTLSAAPLLAPPHPRRGGFALVSTVLIVAVLTIMVVAFLQSMRIDQMTARSYLNKARADLAVEAGFNAAVLKLVKATANDEFFIAREDANDPDAPGPLYFIGAVTENLDDPTSQPTVTFTPLFSNGGVTPSPSVIKKAPNKFVEHPDPKNYFSEAASTYVFATGEPRLPSNLRKAKDSSGPPTVWQYSDGTNADFRFTYWMEDLSGLIDVDVAGNLDGPGGAHQRNANDSSGEPKEIPLYPIFAPSATTSELVPAQAEIINNRRNLLTTGVLNHLNLDPNKTHFFISGLPNDNEPQLVPKGFGYPKAGQPKANLNEMIASGGASGVAQIREAINAHLPNFADARRGGMAANDYLNNIAANIIDYADADSNPTTGPGYRGIDSYPFMTQWFMWTQWQSRSPTSSRFIIHHYIELWNMTNQTLSGTIGFKGENRYIVNIGGTSHNFSTGVQVHSTNISLQPNEYRVLKIGEDSHTVTTGALPGEPLSFPQHLDSNYELRWNDTLVDRAPGGVYRLTRSVRVIPGTTPTTQATWSASIPGLIYRAGSSFLNGNVGDPRASFFLTATQDANNYESRASSGGRVVRYGLESNSYGQVVTASWPDPHENFAPGTRIGAINRLPTSVTPPNPDPKLFVTQIANHADGKLQSIAELGHIFDPGLWRQYNGTAGGETARNAWSDITSSAVADSRYGGGRTLRIGRPEFARFDQPGQQATDLLANFTTEATLPTKGLININTAPVEVLRALGAGINLSGTDKTNPSPISPPKGNNQLPPALDESEGSRFAAAILQNRPFASPHQIATMTFAQVPGDPGPFFGNHKQWGNTEFVWPDRAAERYFRKIYDLCTVRGRSFRIYITGQAIQTMPSGRTRILGTSRKVFTVALKPVRDDLGRITRQEVVRLSTQDL